MNYEPLTAAAAMKLYLSAIHRHAEKRHVSAMNAEDFADWLGSLEEMDFPELDRIARSMIVRGVVPGNINNWLPGEPDLVRNNPKEAAVTSLKQVPAILKLLVSSPYRGSMNVDIGAGKYGLGTEYLLENGIVNVTYDPYNLTAEHNERSLAKMQRRIADTVTVANVLNVIPKEMEREEVIRLAAESIRLAGTALFGIYEGDKSSQQRGNQNNLPASAYIEEVKRYFSSVKKKGNVLIARR